MNVPNRPGSYAEHFDLVSEGITWLNDTGLNFYMNIPQPNYSWQFLDQYAYTDQTKTVGKGTTGLNPGDRVYAGVEVGSSLVVSRNAHVIFPYHLEEDRQQPGKRRHDAPTGPPELLL